jgi:cell wall-associated NlpC family hydrolase
MRGAITQWSKAFTVSCSFTAFLVGCTTNNPSKAADVSAEMPTNYRSGDVAAVVKSTYNAKTKAVHLYLGKAPEMGPEMNFSQENLLNPSSTDGVINYAYDRFPTANVRQVIIHHDVIPSHSMSKTVQVSSILSSANPTKPFGVVGQGMAAGPESDMTLPPPGATMDRSIHPLAGIFDSSVKKQQAVVNVSRNLLGTPYIWGHNEDRGQYGFDSSNFTAYVYHHALGYNISPISKAQFMYVGQPVSTGDMRTGDLLVFDNGKHVGIYVGNQRMIEAGGGMGKVSYMSIEPGSYWGNHLSIVKRMF